MRGAGSLRGRAWRSVGWILAGTVGRNLLRFGSSLVLTRLLYPEAFGLMATLGLLTAAVEVCSDLGLGAAIVHHPHGATPRYLNAAWSLTVGRGFVLASAVAALSWPFSLLFHEPVLLWMGLAHALLPIIRALASPALLLWNRTLEQGRFAAVELLADGVRIALTIALAAMLRSVWVLVAGTLIGELVRTGASYLLADLRPRWCWDRAALRELIRFGRFILASSILGFFAGRLDAVFVARYLGMEQAGVFYIAGVFTTFIDYVVVRVTGQVLFPVLSARQQQPQVLARRTTEAVRLCCVLLLPGCVALALNSALLLALCYDPRYGGAAAAMPWLFVGVGLSAVAHTANAPLLAGGRPHWGTAATLARLAAFCGAAPLLGCYGVGGYAAATTLASAAFLAVLLGAALRRGYVLGRPAGRAGGVLLAAVGMLLAWTWLTQTGLQCAPAALGPLGHAAVLGGLAVIYRRELIGLLPGRRSTA